MTTAPTRTLAELATILLTQAGLPASAFSLVPLAGGRNNKVHRLDLPDSSVFLLKEYFFHPQDPRDRLGNETGFLQHLESSGCRLAPRLIAVLPEAHASLLEFVHGKPIALSEVDDDAVNQAIAFFKQANAQRSSPSARALGHASEACFSISEHLRTTQRRVDRLAGIEIHDSTDRDAASFIRFQLVPRWNEIREAIIARWPEQGRREKALADDERCLSPSDFGFHNALRESTGRIRFLDFEYAGWDDPAKLVCDFANQPDMLLEASLSNRFREAVLAQFSDAGALQARIAALEPLYQVKWSCICLNDFLGTGRSRHRFTSGGDASDSLRRRRFQLDRAVTMLGRTSVRPVALHTTVNC